MILTLKEPAKLIGAGIASSGLIGAGAGIGVVFGSFLLATARNPDIIDDLFKICLIGFALTEAIALFSLMMSFLILFAV